MSDLVRTMRLLYPATVLPQPAGGNEEDEVDDNRGRYIRRFYQTNWLDLSHYDLVIDTSHFTQRRAADLVCTAVAIEQSP